MGSLSPKPLLLIAILLTWIHGKYRRMLGLRRSRKHWPEYDNAILWHGEEVYEFNKSGDIDEYIDVLGTIMAIERFHPYESYYKLRHDVSCDRSVLKRSCIKWWLRQRYRGRPNLNLVSTYYHLMLIHYNIKLHQKRKHGK